MIASRPQVSLLDTGATLPCVVLDGALTDPMRMVELATKHQAAFAPSSTNAYPGLELPLPGSVVQGFVDAFSQHARAALGVRRVLSAHGRLALVTQRPEALSPIQRLCHRDRLFVAPGQRAIAGVLYLFDNPAMGGTSFFEPRQGAVETETLMTRLAAMSLAEANALLGSPPAYLTASNAYFELKNVAPARMNRLIFFDGGRFHGSHLLRPDLLTNNPAEGRLTLNLFMTARCAAT